MTTVMSTSAKQISIVHIIILHNPLIRNSCSNAQGMLLVIIVVVLNQLASYDINYCYIFPLSFIIVMIFFVN